MSKLKLGVSTIGDVIKAVNSIDSKSEYTYYSIENEAWVQKTFNNKTYWTLAFDKSDTVVEVFNMEGQKLVVDTKEVEDILYLCFTSKIECKVRRIQNPSVAESRKSKYVHNIVLETTIDDIGSDMDFTNYFHWDPPKEDISTGTTYYSSLKGKKIHFIVRFQILNTRPTRYTDVMELLNQQGNLEKFPFNASGYVEYEYDHFIKMERRTSGVFKVEEVADYGAISLRMIDKFNIISGFAHIDTIMSSPQLKIEHRWQMPDDFKHFPYYYIELNPEVPTPLYEPTYKYILNLNDQIMILADDVVEL